MDRVIEYRVGRKYIRSFPILSCWDNIMVAERKEIEEKRGGFGRGRVVDRITLPARCLLDACIEPAKNDHSPRDDDPIDKSPRVYEQDFVAVGNELLGVTQKFHKAAQHMMNGFNQSQAPKEFPFESCIQSLLETTEMMKVLYNRTREAERESKPQPMLVSPLTIVGPSIAPSSKTPVVIVDDDRSDVKADVAEDVGWYDEFVGRTDYPGKQNLEPDQRKTIDTYLNVKNFRLIVWQNDVFDADAQTVLGFLFGGMTSSRIIDIFGDCLKRGRNIPDSPRVFVLPTFLQMDFQFKSSTKSRNTRMLNEQMMNFGCDSTVAWLEMIDLQSLETLDYIISPIYTSNHWAVMIYKVQERRFYLRDSLNLRQMKSATKLFAGFLSTYWECMYKYKVNSNKVEVEYTRRQKDEGLDCGVHAAMSMERYIFGPTVRGSYLDDVEVDVYRASMVATILRDDLSRVNHLYE